MGSDRISGDVLLELVSDDLFVRLIDLDDLFDLTRDVAREKVPDGGYGHLMLTLEDLRSVVVFRREYAHKAEPSGAVELPRIEEHSRHLDLALELFEEGRGPVHGKECSCPHDEDDVPLGLRVLRYSTCHELIQRLVFA